MAQLAQLAVAGREALLGRDWAGLAALIDRNLELRRLLYSDAVVGADSLAMAAAARAVGAAAKLAGSGGAVVALCPEGPAQAERLAAECAARGCACVPVQVGPALHTPG